MRPEGNLRTLNFADEMLRREEAVYTRLQAYQGTLLPHSYGFHEFQLSDSGGPAQPRLLGLIMERVPGYRLGSDLGREISLEWSDRERKSLLIRLRHIVRLLNAFSITQRDWHTDQIMGIPRGPGHEGGTAGPANRGESTDLVIFDFAFAMQPSGNRDLLDTVNDVGELYLQFSVLGTNLMEEIRWLDRAEYEQ
ncbi:hypothetical protein EXIGLDRAFT_829174 [Exidia glandulosa HHB12029]|uniref:Protein kinase domain-containing protein n=1 Tax=Exidia glandulosa HHB12029 TaxID=1314781 RepID=A0A165PTL0_EXIGL|nr:hypothetical protein EXIGLDRAFT_829174 [Exidia glandulosa HHB12029]